MGTGFRSTVIGHTPTKPGLRMDNNAISSMCSDRCSFERSALFYASMDTEKNQKATNIEVNRFRSLQL